jgi:hypothetical protein
VLDSAEPHCSRRIAVGEGESIRTVLGGVAVVGSHHIVVEVGHNFVEV